MDEVFVEIESLAPGGDAVGRQRGRTGSGGGAGGAGMDGGGDVDVNDGRVTFIPLAAPGERVRARIVREQGRVAWGELLSIDRSAPDRVAAPCPLFGECGGCQWQHVRIDAQHAAKKVIVERALGIEIPPVIAASQPLGYRDRAKLAVDGGRVGFRARRSHQVVDVVACPLFSERLARALPAVRALGARLPDGAEIDLQAGLTGDAGAPAVEVEEGVCIDVAHVDGAGAAHARREWDRLQAGGVVGLSLAGKPTHGRPTVNVAEPASPPLPASASGFAQVGHQANAVLVVAVLDAAGPDPGHVVELYAGSGNFTRHLVSRAKSVWAYEADPAAVARGRAAVPGATWGLGAPRPPGDRGIDLVLLDPPREGADVANLTVAQKARGRIVYVSCDPQTLARDARRMAAAGFRLARAVALDLMPHTHHVEVVAVFERA